MSGHIDFQIAEGDLVATRWQWEYVPRSWWMKASMLGGRQSIPVINVFRDHCRQVAPHMRGFNPG